MPEPPSTPEVPVEPIPSPFPPDPPEVSPRGRRRRRRREERESAVKEFGTTEVPANKSNVHCLTIIGQIEGHLTLPSQNKTTKYEHLIPQLVAVEQNNEIEGLLIILNTVGGDVEAGLAIAEMIKSLSKPSVSIVLGGGHSIGVPVAVATDYSFIAGTATMTIHPIRLTGMVIGVPQTYEYLDKMQDRVVKFVVQNSTITEERYRELMFRTGELARDIGTILVGQDAVREGIIDAVGGLAEAVVKVEALIRARRNRSAGKPARLDAGPADRRPAAPQGQGQAVPPVAPPGGAFPAGPGHEPGRPGTYPGTGPSPWMPPPPYVPGSGSRKPLGPAPQLPGLPPVAPGLPERHGPSTPLEAPGANPFGPNPSGPNPSGLIPRGPTPPRQVPRP